MFSFCCCCRRTRWQTVPEPKGLDGKAPPAATNMVAHKNLFVEKQQADNRLRDRSVQAGAGAGAGAAATTSTNDKVVSAARTRRKVQ